MRHVIWKPYWNFMKEEEWINEMASKGFSMTSYSWCRYVFDETPNNKYEYRIELLDHAPTHPESIAYFRFLEESGIDCISTYMRWAYFRREKTDEPFEIYTDTESKIMHLTRVYKFWKGLIYLELFAALLNLVVGIINLYMSSQRGIYISISPFFNLGLATGLGLIGLSLLQMNHPLRRRIREYQKRHIIHE